MAIKIPIQNSGHDFYLLLIESILSIFSNCYGSYIFFNINHEFLVVFFKGHMKC